MPTIQFFIPGCGLTPFNVWDLTYEWWLIYMKLGEAHLQANKETSRGH